MPTPYIDHANAETSRLSYSNATCWHPDLRMITTLLSQTAFSSLFTSLIPMGILSSGTAEQYAARLHEIALEEQKNEACHSEE